MKKFPLIHKIIATACGAGYFPWGPGTMGAVFAVALWLPLFLFADYCTWMTIIGGAILIFTILGVWSSTIAERYWGEDPSRVVIDEVVGMWITLLAVPEHAKWHTIVTAFVLFRFFDMVKPLGVRKMENLKSGYGIMADDILAGVYGALVILMLNYFIQ